MPITRNAKKALRSSLKKKAVNDRVKKGLKETTKTIQKLVVAKKYKEAKDAVPMGYSAIDKAVKKGVIKKNTAARKKSLLSRISKESK
jgi:small subunit ribosomal protein S20